MNNKQLLVHLWKFAFSFFEFMFAQNKKLIKTFTIFDANFISE